MKKNSGWFTLVFFVLLGILSIYINIAQSNDLLFFALGVNLFFLLDTRDKIETIWEKLKNNELN